MENADPTPPPSALPDILGQLAVALEGESAATTARIQKLSDAKHEAETWKHRRAARSERDRGCYLFGAAFEPNNGHLVDDIFMAGFDHLGAISALFLGHTALQHREEKSVSGLLRRLSESTAGACIREWGDWARRTWLRNLYWEETDGFLLSKKGQDPKQRWRTERVTSRQFYLAGEIGRCRQLFVPEFTNRGEAFDWIKLHGGNPRFLDPPPTPPLPKLPEVA